MAATVDKRILIRLTKELKDLEMSPPEGVICYPINDNIVHLQAALAGPMDTPYAGGIFKLDIQIPDKYPFEPPRCQFITPVYHPNIDDEGRICLDILKSPPKGKWGPAISIPTMLTSLVVLLGDPNPDDPLLVDIAKEFKENRALFEHKARECTLRYATGNAGAKASELSFEPDIEMDTSQTSRLQESSSSSTLSSTASNPTSAFISASATSASSYTKNDFSPSHILDQVDRKSLSRPSLKKPHLRAKKGIHALVQSDLPDDLSLSKTDPDSEPTTARARATPVLTAAFPEESAPLIARSSDDCNNQVTAGSASLGRSASLTSSDGAEAQTKSVRSDTAYPSLQDTIPARHYLTNPDRRRPELKAGKTQRVAAERAVAEPEPLSLKSQKVKTSKRGNDASVAGRSTSADHVGVGLDVSRLGSVTGIQEDAPENYIVTELRSQPSPDSLTSAGFFLDGGTSSSITTAISAQPKPQEALPSEKSSKGCLSKQRLLSPKRSHGPLQPVDSSNVVQSRFFFSQNAHAGKQDAMDDVVHALDKDESEETQAKAKSRGKLFKEKERLVEEVRVHKGKGRATEPKNVDENDCSVSSQLFGTPGSFDMNNFSSPLSKAIESRGTGFTNQNVKASASVNTDAYATTAWDWNGNGSVKTSQHTPLTIAQKRNLLKRRRPA